MADVPFGVLAPALITRNPQPEMPISPPAEASQGVPFGALSLPDVGAPAIGNGGTLHGAGSPGTAWGNKSADIASKLAYGAMTGLATLPQRAIEASQSNVENWGNPDYRPDVGPAAETAMLMIGGAGVVPAEANALRSGMTGARTYKPGEISFAEKPPRKSERSTGHEFEDELGNAWTYDISRVRDGDNIHGIVSNLKALDQFGDTAKVDLTKVQRYKLENGIRNDVQGHLEDAAEIDTHVARRRAMTPAQRQAEDDAAVQAERLADQQRTTNIHRAVDDLVASGWRPQINERGGWQRPPEIARFASPAGEAKVNARLQQHGISLQRLK